MEGAPNTDPRAIDEGRLVDGLRRGDEAAFDGAYAAYADRVFSFLLRLSGRRDTAEDLAQETWMRLARSGPGLRADTRLGPLLFTIARNLFVSHRRWAALDLSRLVTLGWEAASAPAYAPGPAEEHERASAVAELEASLQALPVASREVLLLVGVEGLEHAEVASILGVSAEALRQRLSRARTQLASAMRSRERRSTRRPTPRSSPKGETA